MDDLLALWDESPPEETSEDVENSSFKRANQHSSARSNQPHGARNDDELSHENRLQKENPEAQIALSVDDRIGIRMINRKMAGIDLMNLITEQPYHSTAQLSAYSLTSLNRILIDPAAVIDAATVCGKTVMVTVGLVFSNSGTRVSSTGNAFCALSIGNLHTGPTVSVLLFGSAYSKYCRSITAGKVVALVNPNLIPSKEGMDTSVTFTANNEHQLIHVADARDYACCKAMVRAKNGNGQWVQDGKGCKNVVDKRVSEYCEKHRQQERAKAALAKGGTLAMQQLRLQSQSIPTTSQGNRILSLPTTSLTQPPPRFEGSHSAEWMAQLQSSMPASINTNKKLANNSLLNPRINRTFADNSQGSLGAFARGDFTVQTIASSSSSSRVLPSSLNPYAPKPTKPPAVKKLSKQAFTTTSCSSSAAATSHIVTGDILKRTKPSSKRLGSADSAKRRAINTDTEGYSGSVPIPKPSKIFSQTKPSTFHTRTLKPLVIEGRPKAEVISRQQLLAEHLRQRKAAAEGELQNRMKKVKKQRNVPPERATNSVRDSLFGSLGAEEVAAAATAKSRFSHEADAEEYARSRRVITELEQDESKKENKSKDSSGTDESNAIKKEWHCLTCKRLFTENPRSCIRMNHQIKLGWKLRTEQSVAERRLALTGKKAEDGGLVLGAGLEWSRARNRFS